MSDSDVPDPAVIDRRFHVAFENMSLTDGELRYGSTETEGLWFWKRVMSSVFPSYDDETIKLLVRRLYRQFEKASAWAIYDGVQTALETLREAGFKMGLLTNWDVRADRLIRDLGLSPYFDEIVVSSEVGFEKPSPDIFNEMSHRLGSGEETVTTIGNSVEVDLEVPDEMGWDTILYTPGSTDSWKQEVDSWSDLADRLLG